MGLNMKETWNFVREAEILWKWYPSKGETVLGFENCERLAEGLQRMRQGQVVEKIVLEM